jgi:hypothetical protein
MCIILPLNVHFFKLELQLSVFDKKFTTYNTLDIALGETFPAAWFVV